MTDQVAAPRGASGSMIRASYELIARDPKTYLLRLQFVDNPETDDWMLTPYIALGAFWVTGKVAIQKGFLISSAETFSRAARWAVNDMFVELGVDLVWEQRDRPGGLRWEKKIVIPRLITERSRELRLDAPPIDLHIPRMSDTASWFEGFNRHFDRHHADVERLERKLDDQAETLKTILSTLKDFQMSATNSLANLQASVTAQGTVIASVETLLTQLSAALAAASPTGDNPAIDAIVTQLNTNNSSLAAAVTANTPAAGGATGSTGATGP